MFKINRFALAALALAVGTASAADKAVVKQNFLRSVVGVQDVGGRRIQIAGCSCQEQFESCGPDLKKNLHYSLYKSEGIIESTDVYKNELQKLETTGGGSEHQLKQKIERIKGSIIDRTDCIKVKKDFIENERYIKFKEAFNVEAQLLDTALYVKDADEVIKEIKENSRYTTKCGDIIAKGNCNEFKEIKRVIDQVTGVVKEEVINQGTQETNMIKVSLVIIAEEVNYDKDLKTGDFNLAGNTQANYHEIVKPLSGTIGTEGLCPCGCGPFTDQNNIRYECECLDSCTDASAGNQDQPDFSCDADIAGGNKCPPTNVCCCVDAAATFDEVCTAAAP